MGKFQEVQDYFFLLVITLLIDAIKTGARLAIIAAIEAEENPMIANPIPEISPSNPSANAKF